MKEYVFLIYAVVVLQIIISKPIKTAHGMCRGRNFYKTSGIINTVFGYIGFFLVNLLLRNKGIVSPSCVWAAIVGFIFMIIYGMYNIYKMITCVEKV